MCKVALITQASRLVQTQNVPSGAVYGILRTQGSEVFVLRSGRPEGVKNADYIKTSIMKEKYKCISLMKFLK